MNGVRPVPELSEPARRRALASLIVARATYAWNWYDVGPIQLAIASGLGVSFGEVSIALWSFLVGVGFFQIPAGILSLSWGARRVSLLGVGLMAAGAIVSALVPIFWVFVLLRGVVGVGSVCFFSPAIGLIARYYEGGGKGFGIGLYNGAFSLGAGVGVYLSVLLDGLLGWRGALLVAGAAMALVTLESGATLPRLPEPSIRWREGVQVARKVLASRYLWLLALAMAGFWAANFAAAQYIVPWAMTVLGFPAGEAGALGAVLIVSPLLGGPLGGAWAERRRDATGLLALSTVLTGLCWAALPFAPELSDLLVWPLAAAAGIVSGMAFGALYYMGTLDRTARRENVPLAVGLINALQVSLGAFLVLALGLWVFGHGTPAAYLLGWVLLGGMTVATLPLLLGVRGGPSPGPGDGPAP